jgi:hypothetical protein
MFIGFGEEGHPNLTGPAPLHRDPGQKEEGALGDARHGALHRQGGDLIYRAPVGTFLIVSDHGLDYQEVFFTGT